MANLAQFWIDSSPPNARGYDVAPNAQPVLHLASSSSLVQRVTYEVHSAALPLSPRATDGAPILTLNNGAGHIGQAVDAETPTANVTLSGVPSSDSEPHLWEVRCVVNGGTNQRGAFDPDLIFSRFVALRNAAGLRKILQSERDEYDPVESWAGAFNDALNAGGGNGPDVTSPQFPVTVSTEFLSLNSFAWNPQLSDGDLMVVGVYVDIWQGVDHAACGSIDGKVRLFQDGANLTIVGSPNETWDGSGAHSSFSCNFAIVSNQLEVQIRNTGNYAYAVVELYVRAARHLGA
jgi:hypothetical protein